MVERRNEVGRDMEGTCRPLLGPGLARWVSVRPRPYGFVFSYCVTGIDENPPHCATLPTQSYRYLPALFSYFRMPTAGAAACSRRALHRSFALLDHPSWNARAIKTSTTHILQPRRQCGLQVCCVTWQDLESQLPAAVQLECQTYISPAAMILVFFISTLKALL